MAELFCCFYSYCIIFITQVQEEIFDYTYCVGDGKTKSCAEIIEINKTEPCSCTIPVKLNVSFEVRGVEENSNNFFISLIQLNF